MTVKIYETLRYYDEINQRHINVLDDQKARVSVAKQKGQEPSAYDWPELADGMGKVEETAQYRTQTRVSIRTARRRVRELALASKKSSPVNSCYHVQWHDVSTDKLLPSAIPFEVVRRIPGVKPVLFEPLQVGNQKWNLGNHARQIGWGAFPPKTGKKKRGRPRKPD